MTELDTGHQPPRTAGRRPALPNGRAVIGGLLVAAAAVGTFAAWSGADDPPSASYVVAARTLAVGEVLGEGDLDLVALDVPGQLAERSFGAPELVIGQRTVAPLAEGELVQRSAVVVAHDGGDERQIAFAIEQADALAGTLEDGERIDVLVTYGSTSSDSITEVVAASAIVAGLPSEPDGSGLSVMLLSLPEGTDALALAHAFRHGAVTLVRSLGSPLTPGARFEPDLSAGP